MTFRPSPLQERILGRITAGRGHVRDIARDLDECFATVHRGITVLRRWGLVSQVPGAHGTLRPCCATSTVTGDYFRAITPKPVKEIPMDWYSDAVTAGILR